MMTYSMNGIAREHPIGANTLHHTDNQQHYSNQQESDSRANSTANSEDEDDRSTLSTIAILRRHTMYDSLVLVKRFRPHLNGYSLEFPTSGSLSNNAKQSQVPHQIYGHSGCKTTRMVSVYLDGDDPILQCNTQEDEMECLDNPEGELVHVPMNGLLDRLDNYDRHGISVDSKVYAFAIGLKTAEKFMTTSSMREIQETP